MPKPEYPVPYYDVSQALVRRQASEPSFSADQQKALQELALSYLQKNKLSFTRDTLRAAAATLTVDCLPRGLAVLGMPGLSPHDNVRRIVRAGLDHRAYVEVTTQEALRSDEKDISRMEGTYVGAYAFDKGLVTRAQANLARFSLTPNITACDTLAYQYSARKQLLPVLAAVSLGSLSKEQFPKADLETFPEANQQAKLVRNSILSLAARGVPFPAVAIEDLRVILLDPGLADKLDAKVLESFFQQIGNPEIQSSEETLLYGQALMTQIREGVASIGKTGVESHPARESELITLRDQLYRSFSSVFLLLHPAIEEKKLITDPTKADQGDYSLWRPDLSVVVEGARIPNAEALLRAERLTEARGYTLERFRTGIQAWKHLEISTREEQEKLARLKRNIKTLAKKITIAKTGNEELPPSAFDLVLTYHRDIHETYIATRKRLNEHEADIKENNEARAAAQDYYHTILQANGGIIPDSMPLPEMVIQKSERSDYLSRRHKLIHYNFQKEMLFIALTEDYVEQTGSRGMQYEEWMALDPVGIIQEIDKMTQANAEGRVFEFDKVQNYMENYLPVIRLRRKRALRSIRDTTPRLPGDQERYEQLKNINSLFIQWDKADALGKLALERRIQTAFAAFTVKNRLTIYQALLDLEQRRVTEIEGPAVQPARTEWSREEMVAWYKDIMSSTLPEQVVASRYLSADVDEISNWLDQYHRLTAYDKGKIWPSNMPNRVVFKEYIKGKIVELEEKIPTVLPENLNAQLRVLSQIRRMHQQIDVLHKLDSILGNSLIPFQEGEGLEVSDFLHKIRERLGIARTVVSLPKDQEAYLEAAQQYNKIALDSYIKSLSAQLQRMQVQLAEIVVNEPAKTRFLQTMGNLNLTLREYSNQTDQQPQAESEVIN